MHVVRGSGVFRGKFAVIANAATEVNQAIVFAAAMLLVPRLSFERPMFSGTATAAIAFGTS